jgi:hypothetical protein
MKLGYLGNHGNFSRYWVQYEESTPNEFTEMIEHEEGFECDYYDIDRNIQYFQASAKGCFLMGQRFPNLKFEERKVY